MKTYTLQVIIEEGNDEFWESLTAVSGCDEVTEAVIDALDAIGFSEGYNASVRLVGYTNKE